MLNLPKIQKQPIFMVNHLYWSTNTWYIKTRSEKRQSYKNWRKWTNENSQFFKYHLFSDLVFISQVFAVQYWCLTMKNGLFFNLRKIRHNFGVMAPAPASFLITLSLHFWWKFGTFKWPQLLEAKHHPEMFCEYSTCI